MSTTAEVSIAHTDPVNAKILAVSEDRIQGFVRDPIGDIAAQSGLDADIVIERIRAMLRAGTIRRVRQTLMATNLAEGALVAWQYPPDKLEPAFEFMVKDEQYILDYDPRVHVLAAALHQGRAMPVAWTKSWGEGRVFYLALGHDAPACRHETFRLLLQRGASWAATG